MTQVFELENGPLRARITDFGATLMGLWHKAHSHSMVHGFEALSSYKRYPIYVGAVVGPVANRIRQGQIRIEGRVWQMPRNEGGRTALHSGPKGLHAHQWSCVSQTDASVTLRASLPHGACGLPGHRTIDLTYTLTQQALQLSFAASSDRQTVMNVAHHPYWAVDADSRLQVHAEAYLPVNAKTLPTGQVASVSKTSFDLRKPAPIPAHLDHNFVLAHAPRQSPSLAAYLETARYALSLKTDAPGLQVYSGAGLPEIPEDITVSGPVRPYAGLALEAQMWPDAPEHPSFPSIGLKPGETWRQFTEYCLNC